MRNKKTLFLFAILLFSVSYTKAQSCITLFSAPGTDDQKVCINSPIVNIVYTLGVGVTGATVSGLPSGVVGLYTPGLFTISGTPTIAGAFTYTITTLGTCVGTGTASGKITVNPLPTAEAGLSALPFCQGGTSDHLNGTVGGSATGGIWSDGGIGGSFSPAATSLNATWTPPAAYFGTATLTLTTTGGSCGTASDSKTQLVNPNATIALTSAPGSNVQVVCLNTAITNITYSIGGGGTGAGVTGLPAGITGVYSAGVFTISGIPIATGTFSYTLTTTGTCTQATATGTIIVNPLPTATASNNGPVCAGTSLSLTGGVSGMIAYSWIGPNGFNSSLQSPLVSSSATTAMAGVYTLTVTNSNGCQRTATTTVTVLAAPVATALNNGPVCAGSPLTLAGGPAGMTSYSWIGPNGFTSILQSPVVSLSATVAMAGVYTLTVRNSNGCQDTATTRVFVNALPVATAANNGPVCTGNPLILTGGPAGMTTYLWTGPGGYTSPLQSPIVSPAATLTMAGLYTLIVTDIRGCQNTASTTVVVNQSPVATALNNGPVCVGSPLILNGGPPGLTTYAWTGPNSYTSTLMSPTVSPAATLSMAGVYTLTATNSVGCRDTATTRVYVYAMPVSNAGTGGTECDLNFVLNAIPSIGTGLWTTVTGPGTVSFAPNANAPGATVTVSAYGTYTFRWTETNGPCTNSSVITVNFYQSPVANAGIGGNACTLSFELRAVPTFGIGTWSMTKGTGTAIFSPNANTPTTTVTVSEYGTKEFLWTEVNGPCSDTSAITVNFYLQPSANAGPGGNNCGLEFNLRAVPSIGTGIWTRDSGPGVNPTFSPNPNSPSATVSVSAYGTHVFRWTETNGTCSNSSTTTVTFIQQPSANGGNGGDECDLNFTLNAIPGAGVGTWSKVSGPGNATFTPNASQYNAVVTVSQYGSYDFAWTEVNSLCTSTDIVRVAFHDQPVISAGSDALLCKGRNIQLNASGSGITFSWTPTNSLNNPNIINPVASPATTTTYTVTMTDQYGCRNSDQVIVEVRVQPVANAGPDQVLEYIFETNFEASPLTANQNGEWTLLSGDGDILDIHSPTSRVTQLSIEKNSFIWTVTNGICPVSSDTVNITVHTLIIPTLITPNLDGKNDYFVIQGIESLGKTSLIVFNRWGAKVYENTDYDNSWDGTDDNKNQLQEDTYFYILNSEITKSIKGYVVIRR